MTTYQKWIKEFPMPANLPKDDKEGDPETERKLVN